MRFLSALLLVFLSVAASAQRTPEVVQRLVVLQASAEAPVFARHRPTNEHAVTMAMTGIGATTATMLLGSELDSGVLVIGAPLVGGATVYAVGDLLGYEGSLPFAMLGAGAGAATGAALFLVGFGSAYDGFDAGVLLAGLGLLSYAVLPPVLATVGYGLVPGAVTTPDGETVPALTLRIGL